MSNMNHRLKSLDWVAILKKRIAQIMLLGLCVFFYTQRPDVFLSKDNILNILRQSSAMGICALGMSFVMLTGGLDFSIASNVAFTAILTAILTIQYGMNFYVAALIAILCATVVGFMVGFISVKVQIVILVVSLAVNQILNGLNFLLSDNSTIFGLPENVKWIGQGSLLGIPIPVIAFVVLALIVSFILNHTYFGRYLFSVGGNRDVARLAGIPVNRVRLIASAFCGFMCGIAGIITLCRTATASTSTGSGMHTKVITAAILGGVSVTGGVGNTSGVITGVLVITVLANGFTIMQVNSYIQDVIMGFMMVLAVTLDRFSHSTSVKKELVSAKVGQENSQKKTQG